MSQIVGKTSILRLVVSNLIVFAFIVILFEGIAGYALFAGRLARASQLAERRHTEYDPLLGWVNRPGVSIPNMYGPGVQLTTNLQRFRNGHDFGRQVAAGRTRVVCSGDSYTLGYGVADDQTWCQILARLNPQLETVNMGQGGYGFDQAFLWYKRDGAILDHQVHVFAFIDDDFDRMGSADFQGYGKPVLKIIDGQLVAQGVPVAGPQSGFVHRLVEYAGQLNSLRLARNVGQSIGLKRQLPPRHEGIDETRTVVSRVLDELVQLNAAHSSRLVLLLLPVPEELEAGRTSGWKSFIAEQAAARNVTFIDAFPDFGSMGRGEQSALFIPEGAIDYPGASGHLTPRGNEFVAGLVYAAIASPVSSR